MNTAPACPSNSSLCALRGAVGEVVGAGGGFGDWDRLVWLWRIFWALDGLLALLWSIVDRIGSGEIVLVGLCPSAAMPVRGVVPGVAEPGVVRRAVRRRAVLVRAALAGVRVKTARRVLAGPVALRGGACGFGGIFPILVVPLWGFSDFGRGAEQTHVQNVPF